MEKTIVEVRNADCDVSWDDNGNPTSSLYSYVVCDDYDINNNAEYFDSFGEAESWIEEND